MNEKRLGETVVDGLREFADSLDHGPQKQPYSVGRIEAQRRQVEREMATCGVCGLPSFAYGHGMHWCRAHWELHQKQQPTTKGRA